MHSLYKIIIIKCRKNIYLILFLLIASISFYYYTNSTSLSDDLEDDKFRNVKIKIMCLILTQPKTLNTKVFLMNIIIIVGSIF